MGKSEPSLGDLPTELLWKIGEAVAQGSCPVKVWSTLRRVNHRFEQVFLELLLQSSSKSLFLRRGPGGPIDFQHLEYFCRRLPDHSVAQFVIEWASPDARNIELSTAPAPLGQHTDRILQQISAVRIIHQFPAAVPQNSLEGVLTPDFIHSQVEAEHGSYLHQVSALLCMMTSLTSLTLCHVLHADEFFQGGRPVRLREITLFNVRVEERILRALLMDNRNTIRALTLRSVWTTGASRRTAELLSFISRELALVEFVFMVRRPGLCQPPSWKGHFQVLYSIFGAGSYSLDGGRGTKGLFEWQRPGTTETFGHLAHAHGDDYGWGAGRCLLHQGSSGC